MTHLTDALLAAVVARLPDTFESHDLIQAVMTSHPQEYVRELYENVLAADPIRTTHSVIGRTLHRVPGITAHMRVESPNVRGLDTENQQWRKTASGVANPGSASYPTVRV